MMMIGRKVSFIAITMIIFLALSINVTAAPILTSHQIMMIQGDDPSTEVVEPGDRIVAVERFYFAIPYNETYVEVPVPKNASLEGMDFDQVEYNNQMDTFLPGRYAEFWNENNPPTKQFLDMTDMDCCYADFYAWEFPKDADRNVSEIDLISTSEDFNSVIDRERSNDVWNFSNSDLRLNKSEEYGVFQSELEVKGMNITKIELSWKISEHPDNISFFISDDNGTTWMDITNHSNEEMVFPSEGNQFLWKVNMSQDIALNNTPVLDHLWINTTYLDYYTYLTFQLDYVLERQKGKFSFTWDFFKNMENGRSPHILLYLDKDHELEAENINIQFWGDQTEFPNKDTYFFMSGSYSPVSSVTISKIEEPTSGDFPWFLLLIFIVIALIVILILTNIPKDDRSSEETDDEGEDGIETSEEDIQGMEEELESLTTKKEGLLGAIKKLDSDLKEGIIDEDVHDDLKSSYKKKTIEVMKQMDILSARIAQATSEVEASEDVEALFQEKKKVLLSIKKLDSDFEEGAIDEESYNELRDEYKKKAVEITKQIEDITED